VTCYSFSFHLTKNKIDSTRRRVLNFYDLFYWLTLFKDVKILIQLLNFRIGKKRLLNKRSLQSLITFKCFTKTSTSLNYRWKYLFNILAWICSRFSKQTFGSKNVKKLFSRNAIKLFCWPNLNVCFWLLIS
jgi:hypothetical protein